jgi:hypothetical protein
MSKLERPREPKKPGRKTVDKEATTGGALGEIAAATANAVEKEITPLERLARGPKNARWHTIADGLLVPYPGQPKPLSGSHTISDGLLAPFPGHRSIIDDEDDDD